MKISNNLTLAVCTAILMGSVFTACKKDDAVVITPPTPLGGYISSDSVASGNLIAYWPFEGNANDIKGGKTATTNAVTYTTGVKGQAYQGDSGSYATLMPSASFAALQSYSYSMWYKIAAQPTNGNPGGMFFLEGTNEKDLLIYELERYTSVTGDSVKLKHGFNNVGAPVYKLFAMESYDTAALNKWVFVTTTYSGVSSTYTVYQNGVEMGNYSAFGQNVTPTQMWTDGTKTVPLGNINYASDLPTQVTIGTWPAGLFGVSPTLGAKGSFRGQMDEIRVFNKALSQSEVNGLYLNGKAGR